MRIDNVSHFDIERTFECGQCFRWNSEQDGSYTGVVGEYVANITYDGHNIYIKSNNENKDFWTKYLDLNRDYGQIEKELSCDLIMKRAIDNSTGIRILKQPIFECLISFIISQNNNIPRIKKIIELLCKTFGRKIIYNNKVYYSFPKPEDLYKVDLSPIKAGFRAKYISDAVDKVLNNDIDLLKVVTMDSINAQDYLKKIKGVGNKVSDCVLLFAYQRFDVFPKDVWIKRIVTDLYNVKESEIANFAKNQFKEYCGIAQQYLFYQARNQN